MKWKFNGGIIIKGKLGQKIYVYTAEMETDINLLNHTTSEPTNRNSSDESGILEQFRPAISSHCSKVNSYFQ